MEETDLDEIYEIIDGDNDEKKIEELKKLTKKLEEEEAKYKETEIFEGYRMSIQIFI